MIRKSEFSYSVSRGRSCSPSRGGGSVHGISLVVAQVVPAHQQLIEFVIKCAKVPISLLALESGTYPVGLLGGLKEPINERRHGQRDYRIRTRPPEGLGIA